MMVRLNSNVTQPPIRQPQTHAFGITRSSRLKWLRHVCTRIAQKYDRPKIKHPVTVMTMTNENTIGELGTQRKCVQMRPHSFFALDTRFFHIIFIGLGLITSTYLVAQVFLLHQVHSGSMNFARKSGELSNQTNLANCRSEVAVPVDSGFPVLQMTGIALAICLVLLQTAFIGCGPKTSYRAPSTLELWLLSHLFSTNLIMWFINHGHPVPIGTFTFPPGSSALPKSTLLHFCPDYLKKRVLKLEDGNIDLVSG
ncbi:unnamed protein product [Echinostoma caproni]|uniref:Uncharacterized protein n=1 Tax=Echinostoma caproni TaxID=27848 RepID=A0A183A5X7_9TREM|nr:unnamed protein product [Echinostoma caproni]